MKRNTENIISLSFALSSYFYKTSHLLSEEKIKSYEQEFVEKIMPYFEKESAADCALQEYILKQLNILEERFSKERISSVSGVQYLKYEFFTIIEAIVAKWENNSYGRLLVEKHTLDNNIPNNKNKNKVPKI